MERPMAALMADIIISLDGYGAAEGWPGYWGMEGPEYLAWIGEDEGQEPVALMGLFDGRLQLLEYVPRVLDGPPGAGG
jgi:hypothetical protein